MASCICTGRLGLGGGTSSFGSGGGAGGAGVDAIGSTGAVGEDSARGGACPPHDAANAKSETRTADRVCLMMLPV
jgi:hypothetical protein